MKALGKIGHILLVLAVVLIILFILWFVFTIFYYSLSGGEALTYMKDQVVNMFASIFG